MALNSSYSLWTFTFFVISLVRNMAIRKPLETVRRRTVRALVAGCQIYAIFSTALCYFAYSPKYTTSTIYNSFSIMSSSVSLFKISSILALNFWSTKSLTGKSNESSHAEERIRKRNQSAVSILNIISLVYLICVTPFVVFYIANAILFTTYKSDDEAFLVLQKYSRFVHFPLFLSSGFNALVYILKDKSITNHYLLWFNGWKNVCSK